jgi:hypothetical protein
MLEGRAALARWGFTPPPRDQVHHFVRLRFLYVADGDLKKVGQVLERAVRLRNQADYELAAPGRFASASQVRSIIDEVDAHLALLDQVQADAPRLAAAIASIRAAFP